MRTGSACVVLIAAALAGCGGGADRPAAATATATPSATADTGAMGRAPEPSHARGLIRMTRVQGDDPLPFSIELRADRTAAVQFGGGHGGFENKAIRLSRDQQRRVVRALRGAPWRRLDGHSVVPGGFGGDDNGNRYSLFYGRFTTTLAQGHIPPRMARLVHLLDGIIDGDIGHLVYAKRHSPISQTPTPPG
ncbi:MAG TPA: hypothetical protein VH276_04405 [Solirubrobacteraceae bacterium]|nr:hypothetical protein [Solirubrobacteraceae bacterium]